MRGSVCSACAPQASAPDRHRAPAGKRQPLARELRLELLARGRRTRRVGRQEHEPGGEQRAELDPGLGSHGAQELLGFLSSSPQPSPVLPSAAIAPRWVSRFSEAIAVCTSQWLGSSSRLAISPKPQLSRS